MRRTAQRVFLLTLGWEHIPKSWSIHGWDPNDFLTEPVPAVVVETDEGYLLLDTGFNPALIRDKALNDRFHKRVAGVRVVLPPDEEDPLLVALETINVSLEDIKAVAVSHLHNDHSGGLRHFIKGTPIFVQQRELEFGLHQFPKAEEHGVFRVDFDDPRLRFHTLNGHLNDVPEEILPGVDAVPTFGHTPGHQSFIINLTDGTGMVLAFDAADLMENFDKELPVGGVVDIDPKATLAHIKTLKSLASEKGYLLVPGHDPHVWPKLTRLIQQNGNQIPRHLTTASLYST